MTDSDVMHIAVQAMILGAKLAAPILLISLVIGFVISLLQAVTQVQEMTLTFVPKVIAVSPATGCSGSPSRSPGNCLISCRRCCADDR